MYTREGLLLSACRYVQIPASFGQLLRYISRVSKHPDSRAHPALAAGMVTVVICGDYGILIVLGSKARSEVYAHCNTRMAKASAQHLVDGCMQPATNALKLTFQGLHRNIMKVPPRFAYTARSSVFSTSLLQVGEFPTIILFWRSFEHIRALLNADLWRYEGLRPLVDIASNAGSIR